MKQFIVLTAVLPLLLVFFLQFASDQINSTRIAVISDSVYAAKEEAKQAGCFSKDLQERLKSELSRRLKISEEKIAIDADEEPVYRIYSGEGYTDSDWERGLIHYKVSVDMGKALAGERLFGIKEKDNVYRFTIDSYTASEKLP